MKPLLIALISNATSIACVVGAIILASKDAEGWGWFLFVALLTFTSFSYTE